MKRYKNLLFGRALPAGILIALQLFWIYLAVTSLLDFLPRLNGIMRVLSIIFVIVILNDRGEQSEYRLIWIIVVLLFPIFGAPFYYMFGNRKPGRGFKRRLDAADVKYHLSYFQDRKTQDAFLQKDVRGAGTADYIFNEQYFPVHQNTQITYYNSGESLLEGMMEAIRQAAMKEALPDKEFEPVAEDVPFDTFCACDLRAVKVLTCERVKKSDKLLKFTLDDGTGTERQILSGIAKYYAPEDLVGKTLLAIVNLPPRKMMGRESNGMLISSVHKEKGEEVINLIILDDKIPAGAKMC